VLLPVAGLRPALSPANGSSVAAHNPQTITSVVSNTLLNMVCFLLDFEPPKLHRPDTAHSLVRHGVIARNFSVHGYMHGWKRENFGIDDN
jgi:hypothetical protein